MLCRQMQQCAKLYAKLYIYGENKGMLNMDCGCCVGAQGIQGRHRSEVKCEM